MLEALLQPCPCECEKHSGELCGTAKARDLQQKKKSYFQMQAFSLPSLDARKDSCYAREPGRAAWQLLPGLLLCHLSQDDESLEGTALLCRSIQEEE